MTKAQKNDKDATMKYQNKNRPSMIRLMKYQNKQTQHDQVIETKQLWPFVLLWSSYINVMVKWMQL